MSTARFALTLGDSLSDHDKQVIDLVLAALETHDHTGGERVADPTGPPTGTLDTTGGNLTAGTTFFYRHAYVDKYGLETAASEEVAFTTPGPIAAPSSPDVQTLSGGTLGPGVSYYALSAVDAAGDETALSDPSLITITTNLTVQVTAREFASGVTSYNVWRQGPRSAGFTKIGSIPDPSIPFIDSGSTPDDPCACDPTNLPPAINLTNATSQVTLRPADVTLVGAANSEVKAWRIYRSTRSGVYGANSLLTEVNTTVNQDGTGGLVTTYVDTGDVLPIGGSPQEISQTLHPSVKILGGSGGLGDSSTMLFTTPSGYIYRIVTGVDGQLVTRLSPGGVVSPDAGGTFLLSDPSGISYRLNIDDYGTLVTTQETAGSGDTVYLTGLGPLLHSPDPTISYKLGVTDDGALTTLEV